MRQLWSWGVIVGLLWTSLLFLSPDKSISLEFQLLWSCLIKSLITLSIMYTFSYKLAMLIYLYDIIFCVCYVLFSSLDNSKFWSLHQNSVLGVQSKRVQVKKKKMHNLISCLCFRIFIKPKWFLSYMKISPRDLFHFLGFKKSGEKATTCQCCLDKEWNNHGFIYIYPFSIEITKGFDKIIFFSLLGFCQS